MSRLEDSLVLTRFLHAQLGFRRFEEAQSALRNTLTGPDATGSSYFYGALHGQQHLRLDKDKLQLYDERIMQMEQRLAQKRPLFSFKYFQYLSLLHAEILLDRMTEDPVSLLHDLNAYLKELKRTPKYRTAIARVDDEFPEFEAKDLGRMAFFLATGSGKTLLMHCNIMQAHHYLEHGNHPEALCGRMDRKREFQNVILITPNEGLSAQHIAELQWSGFRAGKFIENKDQGPDAFGPFIKVIEIHKLAEERSKDGVSIPIDSIAAGNLVLVDEGHKGTGSEARSWKKKQERLAEGGYLMEYSATFSQAIAAVSSQKSKRNLSQEYGKAIAFDYSYKYFYGDGYGKDFSVLNLTQGNEESAQLLMLGSLLTYFSQLHAYESNQAAYAAYNIEKPLWVLLGTSVSKRRNENTDAAKEERTDVGKLLAFLQRIVQEPTWAKEQIALLLGGRSGFRYGHGTGEDLFVSMLDEAFGGAEDVYSTLLKLVFHGSGGLEICELKQSEGEFGLRLSSSDGTALRYFGLINIGDASSFKKYLREAHDFDVKEDHFTPTLFREIDVPTSGITALIGAKKFIEGWSSWRVSCMGLMNVGKGAGSQIIQLFGRGVRLKGRNMSLQRSHGRDGAPKGLQKLETLHINGWNADYMKRFRDTLAGEDIGEIIELPVRHAKPWPALGVPVKPKGYDAAQETWTLEPELFRIDLDMTPHITTLRAEGRISEPTEGHLERVTTLQWTAEGHGAMVNERAIYNRLLQYKQTRDYANVFIPRAAIGPIVRSSVVKMESAGARNPGAVNEAAYRVARSYLDKFVHLREREAEGRNMIPGVITHEYSIDRYVVTTSDKDIAEKVRELIESENPQWWHPTHRDVKPLPRLKIDFHLFNPLVHGDAKGNLENLTISPAALNKDEVKVVEDIQDFWRDNRKKPTWQEIEVYVLRNVPMKGIGMFLKSGFYPDFMLWFKRPKTGAVHLRFLDPHGLEHGGLEGIADKVAALRTLTAKSASEEFQKAKLSMDGYILSSTKEEHISDLKNRGWKELRNEFLLFKLDEGEYNPNGYILEIMKLPEGF